MARTETGAVPRRPHHISSIAHLFLQDEPGERDTEAITQPAREVAVAAPGVSPVSACATAGLALGSKRPVTVRENWELRWSVRAFFPRDKKQAGILAGPAARGRDTWLVCPREGAQMPEETASASPGRNSPGLRWSHLGCLGRAGLDHLESWATARSLVDLPLTGSAGLVWCLLLKESTRLGPSYLLGRLVEQMRPERLVILVFPDPWANAGRPGWLDEVGRVSALPEDTPRLARCEELARIACGGRSMQVHRVVGRDNLAQGLVDSGERESVWRQVADRMQAGGQGC